MGCNGKKIKLSGLTSNSFGGNGLWFETAKSAFLRRPHHLRAAEMTLEEKRAVAVTGLALADATNARLD